MEQNQEAKKEEQKEITESQEKTLSYYDLRFENGYTRSENLAATARQGIHLYSIKKSE